MSDKRIPSERPSEKGEQAQEWIEKRGRNVPPPPPELTAQDTGEGQSTGSGQDSQGTSQQAGQDSDSD